MNSNNRDGSPIENAMEEIARQAARDHLRSGTVVGLGSGSAVARFARALGQMVGDGKLKEIKIVPSSMQAWLLAMENGLDLSPDSAHCPGQVDTTVDGADQISVESRSMIKCGGGALLREKTILSSTKKAVILVDVSKVTKRLSRSVPVEVMQFALNTVEKKIRADIGADCTLRKLDKGYPYFTESGNVILDCKFRQAIESPREAEILLKSIPGVVEAGIFNCKIDKFLVARQDGLTESF